MRKAVIAMLLSALVLTLGCGIGGTKPNPRKRDPEGPKWVCATAPNTDCPLQTGRQPAPTATP